MTILKKTTHDSFEPADKQHYKKRYLVRKLEEQEAKEEIKEWEEHGTEEKFRTLPDDV